MMKNHVSSSLKTILFLNHFQNTISIPTKKNLIFYYEIKSLKKKLESCSIDNIFSYAATPPFSFSGLSFLMSEKKRKLKKIFKLSGFKKSSNYHSINLVFKNNFSPKKFFLAICPQFMQTVAAWVLCRWGDNWKIHHFSYAYWSFCN